MGSMSVQGMQGRPDPAEKFKELDSDSSGGLDKTELSTLAKELSKMTGKTLNVDDSITTYDANNDGQLGQDEMDTMMQKTMGAPTASGAGMQQVMDAYNTNSGDDEMTTLMKMLDSLDQSTDSSSTSSTSNSTSSEDTMSILLKALDKMAGSSSASASRPDPETKFKELDSDSSGGLNKSELDVMAEDIASMTGETMDTEKAINSYDTDKNGELSKTEMDTMMKETMAKSGGSQQASSNTEQVSSLLRQLMEQYATNFSAENDNNVNSII
jgi:Ca2+-binding EF-hand superfamily protein